MAKSQEKEVNALASLLARMSKLRQIPAQNLMNSSSSMCFSLWSHFKNKKKKTPKHNQHSHQHIIHSIRIGFKLRPTTIPTTNDRTTQEDRLKKASTRKLAAFMKARKVFPVESVFSITSDITSLTHSFSLSFCIVFTVCCCCCCLCCCCCCRSQ